MLGIDARRSLTPRRPERQRFVIASRSLAELVQTGVRRADAERAEILPSSLGGQAPRG